MLGGDKGEVVCFNIREATRRKRAWVCVVRGITDGTGNFLGLVKFNR